MKILITGAFGNLGSNTLHYLLKTDHHVTCFDLLTKNNKKQAKRFLKIKDFDVFWGDISDAQLL